MRVATSTATVVDKEPECDHEEASTEEDEWLEATDLEYDETEEDTSEDGSEAVKRRDTRSRLDALVESNHEYRVQEVSLACPCYMA